MSKLHQSPLRICVVGSGTRFMSGISVYTYRLANALANSCQVSAILMRQMAPTLIYPGRKRVGSQLDRLEFAPAVRSFDGIDWYWLPSIFQALALLLRERPQIVIFQWWTGTVLHTYLLLALIARLLGARIIIEFHEVLDTGETRLAFARWYVGFLLPFLLRLASGFTAHSEHDRALVQQHYQLKGRPAIALPHGPHDHYQASGSHERFRTAPESCCNLLFFGVIRPYKGLEDLIRAFNVIPADQIEHYWLTVVGETWEGWTLPTELIAQSPYHERITFVNRYVHDDEVAAFFAGADAVVLPYHRASMSGPLHVAMGWGLPITVTDVGGLAEASTGYEGVILVPPADPGALNASFEQLRQMRGKQFSHPNSWERTAESYTSLCTSILNPPSAVQKESTL